MWEFNNYRKVSKTASTSRAGGFHNTINKKVALRLLLIRMFNTMFVGVDVLGDPQYTNFGRDIVFSADLCYHRANKKPPSEREVARRSRDGRSLRNFGFRLTSL